jgi:hypothetical protein
MRIKIKDNKIEGWWNDCGFHYHECAMDNEMKSHDTEGSALATMGKLCVATWQILLCEAHLKIDHPN